MLLLNEYPFKDLSPRMLIFSLNKHMIRIILKEKEDFFSGG